mgnify:CR=1 FL=1
MSLSISRCIVIFSILSIVLLYKAIKSGIYTDFFDVKILTILGMEAIFEKISIELIYLILYAILAEIFFNSVKNIKRLPHERIPWGACIIQNYFFIFMHQIPNSSRGRRLDDPLTRERHGVLLRWCKRSNLSAALSRYRLQKQANEVRPYSQQNKYLRRLCAAVAE